MVAQVDPHARKPAFIALLGNPVEAHLRIRHILAQTIIEYTGVAAENGRFRFKTAAPMRHGLEAILLNRSRLSTREVGEPKELCKVDIRRIE